MYKEFTKSYAISRIVELNEELQQLNNSYKVTMKYLNKLIDEKNIYKQKLVEHDKELVAKVLEKVKSLITKYDLLKDYQSCAGYTMLDNIIVQIQEDTRFVQQFNHQKAKVKDLEEKIYYKDCQIKKWKDDYKNCSELEKQITKEYQYCLDNWRECEKQLNQQKDKWNDLKDFIQNEIKYNATIYERDDIAIEHIEACKVLIKMQELERGKR